MEQSAELSLGELIRKKANTLTDAERQVADVIQESEELVALFTAGEIAARADVSEATVTRLARSLGFSFSEMQRLARQTVLKRLNSQVTDRLGDAETTLQDQDLLPQVLSKDVQNLKDTFSRLSRPVFNELVSDIVEARHIYVVGCRSSSAMARLLGFCLEILREGVFVQTGHIEDIDQFLDASDDDIMIAITVARYVRQTLTFVDIASEKDMKVYAVTDSLVSPIAKRTDRIFVIKNDSLSIVPTSVPIGSLIHAIVTAVGLELMGNDQTKKRLTELEKMYDETNLYFK